MLNFPSITKICRRFLLTASCLFGCVIAPYQLSAQSVEEQAFPPSFADLMQLSEASQLVAVVEIRDQARVKAERAPGLAPGYARLYLETGTQALLAGPVALRESLAFLIDRPLTFRGKAPKLKKQSFLIFADSVPGMPGSLRINGNHAFMPADPLLLERTRAALRQISGPIARPTVTGIREIISIRGNLAGESETQLFLETDSGDPVSLTILRRPGMARQWAVSWTEIVDQAAAAPAPETLEWYRLACFLPRAMPEEAFLQDEPEARSRAVDDYAFVLESLGDCERRITAD